MKYNNYITSIIIIIILRANCSKYCNNHKVKCIMSFTVFILSVSLCIMYATVYYACFDVMFVGIKITVFHEFNWKKKKQNIETGRIIPIHLHLLYSHYLNYIHVYNQNCIQRVGHRP